MGEEYAISTSSLVTYYGMLQRISAKCSLYLQENKDQETAEYAEQIVKLEQVKGQLENIKKELDKRRNILKFSEEELYMNGGSQEAYLMINFFPGSDAYDKYGETIHGSIWYHKKERERLEDLTSTPGYGRSEGIVYIDSGTDDEQLKHKLRYEGFSAKDIFEVYTTGTKAEKKYRQPGVKTIPNTITVNINSKTFDVVASQQYVLGHYLKDGYSLPPHDLALYYSNTYLFKRDRITEDEIQKYLLKEDKSGFTDLAAHTMLDTKVRENKATPEELEEYKNRLTQRRDRRIDFIKQHLGISENQIAELRKTDFKRYMNIETSAWMFETETLEYLDPNAIIYWDYERFMHTFLRHNPDFFVAVSTKGQGTEFQYSQKDITRVAKILIRELKDKIIAKLKDGKEFAAIGQYYNGNHYQIRIDPDGRLMQFHPMD